MESGNQSPVKSYASHGDQTGSQLMTIQPPSSVDAGSDVASYLSNVSFTASGNVAEPSRHPRPSHRVVPPDEPGTHQVTFTVTISVAFPPGENVLFFTLFTIYVLAMIFSLLDVIYNTYHRRHTRNVEFLLVFC